MQLSVWIYPSFGMTMVKNVAYDLCIICRAFVLFQLSLVACLLVHKISPYFKSDMHFWDWSMSTWGYFLVAQHLFDIKDLNRQEGIINQIKLIAALIPDGMSGIWPFSYIRQNHSSIRGSSNHSMRKQSPLTL